eukprot:scaffold11439_cov137-Skeletonema_marinoi.AAC.2
MGMMTMKRSAQVGSLFAIISSCLLLASIVTTRHAAVITNEDTQLQQNDQSSLRRLVHPQQRIMTGRRLQEQPETKLPPRPAVKLPPPPAVANEVAPSRLNEEQKKQRIKAFLGGIYPHLDDDMLPKYLRDTMPREKLSVMDVWDVDKDIAFFWHIPKASGSTLKNIMNFCFDLKRAENTDGLPSMEFKRNNILNMDTTSPDGLDKSFEYREEIFSSGIDLIVSNYFLAGAALFTEGHRGRTFTIMRHPIEIAQSLFHYRKKAKWERTYREDWNQITFKDYANSESYIGNWVVHQLTGTMPWVQLTDEHLEQAKNILKKRVFVGIADQMDETVRQLREYFGWKEKEPFCAFNYLHSHPSNTNPHPLIERGSETWNLLAKKEKYDMALYHFALELFAGQREMIRMVKGYRGGGA